MDIIEIYNLPYVFQCKNSDRKVLGQLIRCQLAPVYSDLSVILVQIPIPYLGMIRKMQDPLNFIVYSRLGPTAKHTHHRVAELINELLEDELCGFVLEQGGLCCHCLGSAISIHLLHGKNEFVCLEEDEQVCQYG
jgi:hypothetical protein